MKKLFFFIIISFSIAPTIIFAQVTPAAQPDTYTLLAPLPCIQGVSTNCTPGNLQEKLDLKNYILYVYKFSIGLAVLLAIIMITWGGFSYVTSEIPFIKSEGKSKIQNAITGLVFVLISYLILGTIDPRLVNIDINIPKIPFTPEQQKAVDSYYNEVQTILTSGNVSQQKKDDLQKYKGIIDSQSTREQAVENELSSGHITQDEADAQYKTIETETRDAKLKAAVIKSEYKTDLKVSQAFVSLTNPALVPDDLSVYTADPISNQIQNSVLPTNGPNQIQNYYNTEINSIIKDNPNALAETLNLRRQRDFYVPEIADQVKIKESIDKIETGDTSAASRADLKKTLEADLTKAQAQFGKSSQILSGLEPEKYDTVIQNKIDMIKDGISKIDNYKNH